MKYNLNHLKDPSDVLLMYEGKFDRKSTKSVLHIAERNIDTVTDEPSVKRKVFNVLVECLQNVVKHGEKLEESDPSGITIPMLMIGREPENYVIASGNAIKNNSVSPLKSRIEEINNLDKNGLKELYKDIMRSNDVSEKGGAGLGLVDMARKSGERFSYHFDKIDEDFSFFSFKIVIPRQNDK